MTWAGIAYVVIAALALMAALVHGAQAVLTRRDQAQVAIAAACLGFACYGAGYAGTRGLLEAKDHFVAVLAVGMGLVLTTAFVPMVAWTLLELPLTPARRVIILALLTVASARLVDLAVHRSTDSNLTLLEVPGGLAAVATAVLWTVESFNRIRSGTPFARAMTAFGVTGVAWATQGLLVVVGVIDGPELFGFAALPFIILANTLSTLRYAHALQHANQPAGDLSRYQVLEKLGSGGMGDVVLARRRGPAGFLRDVVLKTLRNPTGDAEAHQRFLAEARLAARLRHPNIIDVYDLGEQPGGFFIVMEHLEGPNLGQLLGRSEELGRKLGVDVVAELGVQLCRALDFAHAAGVIHRDLKLQNVMVTVTGVAKLIDFGIAQAQRPALDAPPGAPDRPAVERLTADRGVAGTHGYIAPERLFGGRATPASDLFSLGVVLYQLLTCEYPFNQATSVEFIAAVREGRFERLARSRPDCPAGLAALVEQCLRYEAAERPPSAASVGAQLEHTLEGRRVDLSALVASLFQKGERVPEPVPATPSAFAAPDATTVTTPARRL